MKTFLVLKVDDAEEIITLTYEVENVIEKNMEITDEKFIYVKVIPNSDMKIFKVKKDIKTQQQDLFNSKEDE